MASSSSWKTLRIKISRQFPIYVFTEDSWLERFIIPDFVCFEKKLIIEIDGSIHKVQEIVEIDKEKEKLLQNIGFKILRIKNEEIHTDIEKVLIKIQTQ